MVSNSTPFKLVGVAMLALMAAASASAATGTPTATVTELSGLPTSVPGSVSGQSVTLTDLTSPAAFTFGDSVFSGTGSFSDTFTFDLDPATFTGDAFGFQLVNFSQFSGLLSSLSLVDQTAGTVIKTVTSGNAGWVYQIDGSTLATKDTYSLIVTGNVASGGTPTAQYSGVFQTVSAVPEPANALMLLAVAIPMMLGLARRAPGSLLGMRKV